MSNTLTPTADGSAVEIHTDSWADFTSVVAEARSLGATVTVKTGPESAGGFHAVIHDRDEGTPGLIDSPNTSVVGEPVNAPASVADSNPLSDGG